MEVVSPEKMLSVIRERKSDIGLISYADGRHTRGGETYDLTLKWNYS